MTEQIQSLLKQDYEAGFVTRVDSDTFAPGLDEEVVRRISARARTRAHVRRRR